MGPSLHVHMHFVLVHCSKVMLIKFEESKIVLWLWALCACRKQHPSQALGRDNAGCPQNRKPNSLASNPALQKAIITVASQSRRRKILLTGFFHSRQKTPTAQGQATGLLRATWPRGQEKLKSSLPVCFLPSNLSQDFSHKALSYSLIFSPGKSAHTKWLLQKHLSCGAKRGGHKNCACCFNFCQANSQRGLQPSPLNSSLTASQIRSMRIGRPRPTSRCDWPAPVPSRRGFPGTERGRLSVELHLSFTPL